MNERNARGRLIAIGFALCVLIGCEGGSNKKGDLGINELPIEKFSALQIFTRGEFELERKQPKKAAKYFAQIERLYPYSEWAKRALMMQAFSHHQANEYGSSRAVAQRFIDFYPADDDAAYAQFLLALSYYDQIDDVGRDQQLTYRALQELRTLIERYPESEYARSAILKFDLAFDNLAAKEMEVGRYYLKRGHFSAAANRFRVVIEDFQTSTHTAEALHRLVEAYLSLGLTDEAQSAGAILGYNYVGSDWYLETYNLLTERQLELEPAGNGWLRKIYRQVIQGGWL